MDEEENASGVMALQSIGNGRRRRRRATPPLSQPLTSPPRTPSLSSASSSTSSSSPLSPPSSLPSSTSLASPPSSSSPASLMLEEMVGEQVSHAFVSDSSWLPPSSNELEHGGGPGDEWRVEEGGAGAVGAAVGEGAAGGVLSAGAVMKARRRRRRAPSAVSEDVAVVAESEAGSEQIREDGAAMTRSSVSLSQQSMGSSAEAERDDESQREGLASVPIRQWGVNDAMRLFHAVCCERMHMHMRTGTSMGTGLGADTRVGDEDGQQGAVATEVTVVAVGQTPAPAFHGVSCVYLMCCPDGVFYVGETDNIHGRVRQHRSARGMQASTFAVLPVAAGKSAARDLEAHLIRTLRDGGVPLSNRGDHFHTHFGGHEPPF